MSKRNVRWNVMCRSGVTVTRLRCVTWLLL